MFYSTNSGGGSDCVQVKRQQKTESVEWHDYRYAILLLITESEKRRVLEGFVKTMKLALFTIYLFIFFGGEIVHEILDIKNMTHIYFSWDQNQDVAILAFLKH
ncbi:hypothetical protein RGQ29_017871 [Quercus rubra]|uniref:Uncharacterized protein n=1 Tax=Quercus rubra TaxID=3512 RepID=A0AAN7FMS5_QUERU|nr:hypothetical protein RGQ29_017871 [Quercus rubra]